MDGGAYLFIANLYHSARYFTRRSQYMDASDLIPSSPPEENFTFESLVLELNI
jgi:hypothetical protein